MFATIIIWASWVIGGIALLLLLAIYFQRIRNAARHSWFERRSQELLPLIYAYLQDEMPLYELKAEVGSSIAVAESLILELLGRFTGEGRVKLIDAARQLGLIESALTDLRNIYWTRRDWAAVKLGIYGLEESVDPLKGLLNDRRREVRYTAARSLAQIGSAEAAAALTSILDSPELFDTTRVLEIVQCMKDHAKDTLDAVLANEDHPLHAKLLAIDLVGDLHQYSMAGMLHEVLRSSNSEKVVRAVKAIGKLSSRKSFEEILQLSKHPEWPVRAQAVKAIGQLELDEGLPLLREALSDRSYWVRRNAAEALVSLGEKGYEILAHPERFEDGFAQDMVRYQLQRLNGEGISPEGDRDSADPSQVLGSESETGGWSSASSTT